MSGTSWSVLDLSGNRPVPGVFGNYKYILAARRDAPGPPRVADVAIVADVAQTKGSSVGGASAEAVGLTTVCSSVYLNHKRIAAKSYVGDSRLRRGRGGTSRIPPTNLKH